MLRRVFLIFVVVLSLHLETLLAQEWPDELPPEIVGQHFTRIVAAVRAGHLIDPDNSCRSRIFMRPWVDSNDAALERLETRQFDSVWLTVPDDRPAHLDPKNGAFATDDNNPGTRTAVV